MPSFLHALLLCFFSSLECLQKKKIGRLCWLCILAVHQELKPAIKQVVTWIPTILLGSFLSLAGSEEALSLQLIAHLYLNKAHIHLELGERTAELTETKGAWLE